MSYVIAVVKLCGVVLLVKMVQGDSNSITAVKLDHPSNSFNSARIIWFGGPQDAYVCVARAIEPILFLPYQIPFEKVFSDWYWTRLIDMESNPPCFYLNNLLIEGVEFRKSH